MHEMEIIPELFTLNKKNSLSILIFNLILLGLCSSVFCSDINAQSVHVELSDSISWDYDGRDSKDRSVGAVASDIFIPKIITDTKLIRAYIRDERFQMLRERFGDMRAIDAIYLKSLKIADYNIARALFLSLMAVLEHRKVNLKLPILKLLDIPLSFEGDSVFYSRIRHLPARLYPDTPKGANGDRDKLQHFFGSAYLSYATEAPKFALTVGIIIEWGEATFVIEGSDDFRDKRANRQGGSFGRDLLVIENMLPSDYLTFPFEDRK